MPKKGHIPERTCISCRKKLVKYSLYRFCIENNKLVWDKEFKKGGRGAYFCKDCIKNLKKKKMLSRLLKALRVDSKDKIKISEEILKKIEI